LDTANYFRKVTVLVDGKKVGNVGFADIARFEIPEESSALSVKLDWCKSRPVELSPEIHEEVFFVECSSSAANIFIHTDQYLRLHKVNEKDLPSPQQLMDFRKNFRKVACISSFMILLFSLFFICTIYVAIFEKSPLWL